MTAPVSDRDQAAARELLDAWDIRHHHRVTERDSVRWGNREDLLERIAAALARARREERERIAAFWETQTLTVKGSIVAGHIRALPDPGGRGEG